MRIRLPSTWVLCALFTLLACDEAGPPAIAGGWIHCEEAPLTPDPEWVLCEDTGDTGWYFPADGGALMELRVLADGSLGCFPAAVLADTSWTEQEDGSVLVRNQTGVGDYELARMGDYLESANDGIIFTVGVDYMRKVAEPGLCPE